MSAKVISIVFIVLVQPEREATHPFKRHVLLARGRILTTSLTSIGFESVYACAP
jgi:hypothetical protein